MGRRLVSSRAYADLFGVPTDSEALIRHYLLSGDDIDLIRTRRRAENHLCGFRKFPDSDYGNSRTLISVNPGQGFQ